MTDGTDATKRAPAAPGLREWLFDPFTYIAGGRSLVLGLAGIVVAGALGFVSRTHFDGVLDVHTGLAAPFGLFVVEGIVDWVCLAVILLIIGKLASRARFRAIDLIGTQAMARWPTVIIAAAVLAPGYQRTVAALPRALMNPGAPLGVTVVDLVIFGLVALFIVAVIVWMVLLMYRSYRLCCNLTGTRAVSTFIIGVLAAEAASKVAVLEVLKHWS